MLGYINKNKWLNKRMDFKNKEEVEAHMNLFILSFV